MRRGLILDKRTVLKKKKWQDMEDSALANKKKKQVVPQPKTRVKVPKGKR